jgi:hypothetical protein
MRKALVGLMIAATAMTPITTASAQGRGGDGDDRRVERQERRTERAEQREERSQARVERREQRQAQPRFQPQARERNFQPQQRQQQVQQRERFQPQVRERSYQPQRQAQQDRYRGSREFVQRDDRSRTRTYDRSDNRRPSWGGVNRSANRSGTWSGRTYNWNRNGRTYSWNQDWRRDRRYDWYSYRNYNRSLYNLGRYYAPYRGYDYQRFSIGFFLEPLFYSSNYWLGNPGYYRLPPAYPGTQWVRYYDDVLLVDVYSGEVIDVIYDFFW